MLGYVSWFLKHCPCNIFLMATPTAYGSSWAKDHTLASAATLAAAVRFLMHSTTVGTPMHTILESNFSTYLFHRILLVLC